MTSLMSKSESATASRNTISSARKPKKRSSLSESLKRSVLKTGNAFLWLELKNSLTFASYTKIMQNGTGEGGSSRSLVLLLFTRFLWDCTEMSMYGSSEVYRSRPDVLGHFARSHTQTFSNAAPCKGLSRSQGHANWKKTEESSHV